MGAEAGFEKKTKKKDDGNKGTRTHRALGLREAPGRGGPGLSEQGLAELCGHGQLAPVLGARALPVGDENLVSIRMNDDKNLVSTTWTTTTTEDHSAERRRKEDHHNDAESHEYGVSEEVDDFTAVDPLRRKTYSVRL